MPRPARRRPVALATPPGLSERLIRVTEELLAEGGLEALSLREVARRAGVTHGAPLRHFPRFATLLSAVAARGFEALARAVEAAAAAAPAGDPLARLVAGARAYFDLALAEPARFALMFRPELLDFEEGALARASGDAFEGLVRLVRAAQDAGWQPGRETRRLAGAVWAALHGLATLEAQGAYAVVGVPGAQAFADTIALLLGDPPEEHGAPARSPRRRA
jgi:AcrR family transcriptional regulator